MGYYLQKTQSDIEYYRKLAARPVARKKHSIYRGVTKSNSPKKPWKASFNYQGVKTFLGHFETERQAAEAYNRMARGVIGEGAVLNEFDDD